MPSCKVSDPCRPFLPTSRGLLSRLRGKDILYFSFLIHITDPLDEGGPPWPTDRIFFDFRCSCFLTRVLCADGPGEIPPLCWENPDLFVSPLSFLVLRYRFVRPPPVVQIPRKHVDTFLLLSYDPFPVFSYLDGAQPTSSTR